MLAGHSLADETGRLIAVDPQICEILQRHEGDLLGRTYQDVTHPGDVDRNTRLVERLRLGAGPLAFTKRYLRPDGSSVRAKVRVSRLAGHGRARLLGSIEKMDPPAARAVERRWRAALLASAELRLRREQFGADMFGDFAYALLLETYLAEMEGRLIGRDEVAARAGTAPGIAARWLRVLAAKGWIDGVLDPAGAPQLTLAGTRKIEGLLDAGQSD